MPVTELESFVKKFEQLWKSGHNVHLAIDSQAGNASVSLHLNLGRYPGPIQVPPPVHAREKVVGSPSRIRRRARREAARAKKVGNYDDNTADMVVDDITLVEQTCKSAEKVGADENECENVLNKEKSAENAEAEINDPKSALNVENYEVIDEYSDANVAVANKKDVEETSKSATEKIEVEGKVAECEMNDDNVDVSKMMKNETTDYAMKVVTEENKEAGENIGLKSNEKELNYKIKPIVTIHATAVIADSPNAALTSDEIDSLMRFLTNRDHLQRNISNIAYEYLCSEPLRNCKFKHTVGLKIDVRTENLWEGPRSYLWKHVGQDLWSRGNGSVISVARIHQK